MMSWRVGDVPKLVDGQWLASATDDLLSQPIAGVSIDSRRIKPGEVFVAIEGEQFDGHNYVDRAIQAGALIAIGQRGKVKTSERADRVLVVDDSVVALGRLGAAHRDRLGTTTVVGVTGSNGKTTVCRLIHAALSTRLQGVRNRRSFNNDIGVPLTLLKARRTDDFLVCEIGSNAPGEVDQLAGLVRPDIGVVTSAGVAHVGGFGSVDAVIREKASIARWVRAGGVVFVPDTPAELVQRVGATDAEVVSVGWSKGAAAAIVSATPRCVEGRDGLRIELTDGSRFWAPVLGRHNAVNVALAVAVARRLGADDEAIACGLDDVQMPAMRLERSMVGGVEVFNDAYNANPESMRAAIETFFEMTASANRRALILGDMLELGSLSQAAHIEALQAALASDRATMVVAAGEAMAQAARLVGSDDRLVVEPTVDAEAIERMAGMVALGDAVLLKGSRRMGLERVVEAMSRARSVERQATQAGR